MADDVVKDVDGVAITFAYDEIAGKKYARLKLIYGDDGISEGDVSSANPLPVSDQDVVEAIEDNATPRAATATLTLLASSVSSAQLLAVNSERMGLILTNTDEHPVYVKYGTTASKTSFSVIIPADGYWAMPFPIYTGRIDAIWVSAESPSVAGVGSLYATEM